MQRIAWIAALLAALAASPAMPAKIYRWSDARGQIHYGELPPIGQPAQALDIQAPPAHARPAAGEPAPVSEAPTSANGQPTAGPQGESSQRAQPISQDSQPPRPSCEIARQNLRNLQAAPGNRRFREPSGHVVRYTEAQLRAKIAATEHYLAQHCPAP